MPILLLILLIVVFAVGVVVVKGVPARRAALIWLWVVFGVLFAAGLGFLAGDVGRGYRDEGIRHLIQETDQRLQAGECERVTAAYRQAQQHRAVGGSSHAALGVAIAAMRGAKP